MSAVGDDDWLAVQLRETERGEAAGHLAHPEPRWFPVALGVWTFSTFGGADAIRNLGLAMLWILAHHLALFVYQSWWLGRRTGVRARGPAPAEFRVFYVVLGLLAVAMFLVMYPLLDGMRGWWAAALTGVVVTAFSWIALRVRHRITRTVKERLA